MPTVDVAWNFGPGNSRSNTIIGDYTIPAEAGRDDVVDLPDGGSTGSGTYPGQTRERSVLSGRFTPETMHLPAGVSIYPEDPLAAVPPHDYYEQGSFPGTITYPNTWDGARLSIAFVQLFGDSVTARVFASYRTSYIARCIVTRVEDAHKLDIRAFDQGHLDYEEPAFFVGLAVKAIRVTVDGTSVDIPVQVVNPGNWENRYYHAEYTFDSSDAAQMHSGIHLRTVNSDDSVGAAGYLNIGPFARFTYDENELDASTSKVGTGTITGYEWAQRPYLGLGDFTTDGFDPQHSQVTTPEELQSGYQDLSEIQLQVQATMRDGVGVEFQHASSMNANPGSLNAIKNYYSRQNLEIAGGGVAAIHDQNGITLTAARENGGIQVNRFYGTASSKEAVATIPGARNPSLYLHGSTPHLTASVNGQWNVYNSHDMGGSFILLVTNIMDGDFTGVQTCDLKGGGALLAGLKKNTREVWTCITLDSKNFSAPVYTGHTIPDDQRKAICAFQEHASGASRVRITNGDTFTIVNNAYAEAGSPWEAI